MVPQPTDGIDTAILPIVECAVLGGPKQYLSDLNKGTKWVQYSRLHMIDNEACTIQIVHSIHSSTRAGLMDGPKLQTYLSA